METYCFVKTLVWMCTAGNEVCKGHRLLIVDCLLKRHGGVFVSSSQQIESSLEDILEQQRQPRTGLQYLFFVFVASKFFI